MNIIYYLDCEIYQERYEEIMTLLEECVGMRTDDAEDDTRAV